AGNIHTVDWSADGRWLALGAVQPHPDLYILDTECFAAPETCPQHLTRLSEGSAVEREFGIWPSISADGTRLVYSYASARLSPSQVYMLDWQNHQRDQLTFFPNGAEVPAWSPDERYVAFAGRNLAGRNIYILDVARRLTAQITRSGGVDSPAWRPSPS
ncbi:MAG: PD40 domain-containing protein, partial [Burkholderiales bacterium]|nr:PD40 domain-containing protein [Anaerolineae bacterium]